MLRVTRGMTLIDVIVGTALILVVFMALFGLLRASIQVVQLTKAKAIATTIAESQMEYARSLNYDQIGTIGGIPAGVIAQYSTTTSNGVGYGVRTFIDYVDDPADGTGGADTNGIITDYKRIKVTVTYMAGGQPRTVMMLSNYSPIGLETTTGGGTLKIVVVNAAGAAVSGASVHIVNSSAAPSVDLTTFSDATGIVYLPGAMPSSQYQIYVTKSGYSSAQTYLRDATNVNPTPGYLTVSKDLTTTATFAIDLLSTLTVHSYTPIATTTFTDTFADGSGLRFQNSTQASGGALTLSDNGSGYAASGNAISAGIAPAYLVSWLSASTTKSTPGNTTALLHVVDGVSDALLPDSVLAGNSAGFTAPVDLSGVSTTTYPSLALRADLTTDTTSDTPAVQEWGLSYKRGPIPLASVPFTLTGAKTTGATSGGAPIYKTIVSTTTGATGVNPLSLEWDGYSFALSTYDTVDACNAPPYAIAPGTSADTSLYVVAPTANSLLVSVRDAAGVAVSGATVTLSNSGYTSSVSSTACGGAYFGSLAASNTYTITVSKAGYTTDTNTNVSVSSHTFYADSL